MFFSEISVTFSILEMENVASSTKAEGFLSRMALNDNKAGMEGLDRDKINKIIIEASKGSRFYENELKREKQVNQRIEKMLLQKAQITESQLKSAQAQVDRMVSSLENSRDLSRVIVHVDMDAFYAAVEMRDCPELKDKPMAVGSMSMLSTSNYHARKYGVRAAMPGFIAKKLCPNLIIVPTNFDKYRAVSNEIREIFADYDPHFQPLSLDEAYLDFTDHVELRQHWPESSRTHQYRTRNLTTDLEQVEISKDAEIEEQDLSPILFEDTLNFSPSPPCSKEDCEVFGISVEEAVREMRFRIEQKTMLTASAGIAPNMVLAKVCSDKNKPNGQYRLSSTREAVVDFIRTLPVRKISRIGKVSEKMLKELGITNCSHLGRQMALLSLLFSETSWHHFIEISLGLGPTYIPRHEERKSMSIERTFKEMNKAEEQVSLCRELCEELAGDMKKEDLKGKTVTLKLKNVNFEVKTKAQTMPYAIASEEEIFAVAKDLLKVEMENESPQPLRLRLMGVRISAFVGSDYKKQMQKSIIGFLKLGKTNCSGNSQGVHENSEKDHHSLQTRPVVTQICRRHEETPWRSKHRQLNESQAAEEPRQSFFQRAQAKRLEQQMSKVKTQEEGSGEDLSTSTRICAEKHSASPVKPNNNTCPPGSELSDGDFICPVVASTSGCGGMKSESLTCPVCFRQVETIDLKIFNRHIDYCLSDGFRKPNQSLVVGSELVVDYLSDQTESEAVDKSTEKHVTETLNTCNGLGRVFCAENQHNLKVLLINGDGKKPTTKQQPQSCDSEGAVLICPVCQLTQETDDLTVFNHHVDLCLNQEVLLEMKGQISSSEKPPPANSKIKERDLVLKKSTKSKRRDSPSSPPSKKAKNMQSCNTIDRYLR